MGSMGRPNGNNFYCENLIQRPFQLSSSGTIPELPDDYTDKGKKVTRNHTGMNGSCETHMQRHASW
jgi:hypothetical protein